MTESKREPILDRYRKALETLTPGGSEFYGEPERCAEFVRDRLSFTVQQQKRIAELVKALEAAWAGVPDRVRAALDSDVPSVRNSSIVMIPMLPEALRLLKSALTAAGRKP